MKFFVLSHSQKKGNVGVAYIINWPHPFSLKIATPASLEISPTPPKKKNNLVYKKKLCQFYLKHQKEKNSGGWNKNKNGVIESPKQKNLVFLFMLSNCNKGLRISRNISQG